MQRSWGRKSRIENVQQTVTQNQSLADNRGNHQNHSVRLTENIKTLIEQHCQSLPHSESHYSREDSKLNYFDDSSLTLHGLYNLFVDYYASVTGDTNIPIGESAYMKFVNHYINFSFSSPRIDVCDICYKYETLGKDKEIYEKHKKSAEDYKQMKTKMANTKSVSHCEFDFAQNLPLPYIPVNSQFYP